MFTAFFCVLASATTFLSHSKAEPLAGGDGAFPTDAAACDACFVSYTKTSVNPTCLCMARETGPAGYGFFCAQNLGASKYIAEKKGCQCLAQDMQNLGETTCNPIEWSDKKIYITGTRAYTYIRWRALFFPYIHIRCVTTALSQIHMLALFYFSGRLKR